MAYFNDSFGKSPKSIGGFDLASVAKSDSVADQVLKATGSFGLPETATDRLLRDMQKGSLAERAAREAIGGSLATIAAGLYPKPSVTELAITRAHAEAAGLITGTIGAHARNVAAGLIANRSIADVVGRHTIGAGIAEAVRASTATRFADAALTSSVIGLRQSHYDNYQKILRQIAGLGSLGSIAAGLATERDQARDLSSRLFDDVAGRIHRASALSTGAALRRAHAELLPPLRVASRRELDALIDGARNWTTLSPYPAWLTAVQSGFGDLASKWVRADRPELSIDAMMRFGHLGGMVANFDPREAALTAELRARFGDYRSGETSEEASDDPLLRVAEQYDRGFDPVLSSLPTRVVVSMLAPFGLRFDVETHDDEFDVDDLVGRMLRRLEKRLMTFVRATLEAAHGDEWIMHVPSDVRTQLRRRRRKDEEAGREPSELIAYADFDWWATIIGHDDNWGLFAASFGSFDAVRETLTRIKPIRHASAHARVLGVEDLIMLAADGLRLLRWIGAEH